MLLSPAWAEGVEWPLHGLDSGEQRFSPLALIDRSNVSQLGLACSLDTPYRRGLEATPIVVDGVMCLIINWSEVYAIDPVSGELLWHYDPQVPREETGDGWWPALKRWFFGVFASVIAWLDSLQ